MERFVIFSRDLSTAFLAMFAVIGIGGFMRGFMTARGEFFEIGAISSWVCLSTALWLSFTRHDSVKTKKSNLFLVLGFCLSCGVTVHQNVYFLVWFFQDYLDDGIPLLDMSNHYILGPLTLAALAWSWVVMKSVMFREASNSSVKLGS